MYRPLVYVVGDAMLDRELRLPAEGPGYRACAEGAAPVLPAVGPTAQAPGGAANLAANLAALGCETFLFAPVPAEGDPAGDHLRRLLAAAQVRIVALPAPGLTTKTRYYHGRRLVARFDDDHDSAPVVPPDDLGGADYEQPHAIVLTDYGRGAVTRESVTAWARAFPGVPVYGDPKVGRGRVWYTTTGGHRLAGMFLNETELRDYVPIGPDWSTTALAREVVDEFIHFVDCPVVIKRGPRGSVLIGSRDEIEAARQNALFASGRTISVHNGHAAVEIPRIDPDAFWGLGDVQGAGDTYLAAAVAATSRGLPLADACVYASAAAGAAVARTGTTAVTSSEVAESVRRFLRVGRGVVSAEAAADLARRLRAVGLRVGYTNGCFDVRLHSGHLHTLRAAAAGCDFLIAGLDEDHRVRSLKGPGRPVIHEADRAAAVGAVAGVGASFVFRDPESAVRSVRPHVIFKGGDYDPATMPETAIASEWGGVVVHVGSVDCPSTTDLVARLFERAQSPR